MHDNESKEVKNENKSIVEWAIEHAKLNKNAMKERVQVLKKINAVRFWKEVLLQWELLYLSGKRGTQCVKHVEAKSKLKWKTMEHDNEN